MNKTLVGILVLIILSVALMVGLNMGSTTSNASIQTIAIPTPKTVNLDADKLWSLIQNWRQSQGLTPYIKNQRLCRLAEQRIQDLKDKHGADFNHSQLVTDVNQASYIPPYTTVSENITGGLNESDMLNRWINSPEHLATLRKDYKYSCVAVHGTDVPSYEAVQEFSNF